jgi:hypothetical protein
MPLVLAAVVAASFESPPDWYGPVTVTSPIAVQGNPFDPAENDVKVVFVGENGVRETRLAYFVGNGRFASTLVARRPGRYRAEFVVNGRRVLRQGEPVTVTRKLPHGFIRLNGRRFEWSDGTPYFPLGYNYAWRSIPNESVPDGLRKMGRTGNNWARIWADHWDNKNPFWPADKEHPVPSRQLRQEPLQIWDGIVGAAEQSRVNFQFVLFHHGPYSTTTDSNWRDHPWNTMNGGFLADPTNFFVDPEAKRRTKIWLRYAVARYAHSPAVMAWELFNEVQWVDAVKLHPERTKDVAAWHREMAAYLRSLDPYHHLVTSSSSESLDSGVFASVDYLQPHAYPANVLASIGGYRFPKKPGFFGEFGPPAGPAAGQPKLVRDGIYGGILAGHAGAGMYWFWDQVDRRGLAPSFIAARRVIDGSGLLDHRGAKPLNVWCDTPNRSDAVLAAGLGWAKSTTTELNLPKVDVRALGGWSQYFQSQEGGQRAWAKPLTVRFRAAAPGKMTLNVGQVSSKGGSLQVWVNDRRALDRTLEPPAAGARPNQTPITVEYPAGPVTVRIENHGADWIRLDSITIPDQSPTAYAHGLGDREWALVRVVGNDTSSVRVSGLGLPDGRYEVRAWDAANGASRRLTTVVRRGTVELANLANDSVLSISR